MGLPCVSSAVHLALWWDLGTEAKIRLPWRARANAELGDEIVIFSGVGNLCTVGPIQ